VDDKGKTKEQLLGELAAVRRRVAELEAAQSERKRAEEALWREHDLLNRVMETSPAGITVVDREGQIAFANARAEQVLGLTRDEIAQRTYNAPEWRITDFEGSPFPDEALPFRRVIATGQPVYDVRHAIEWPDGRRVLLSINATPLFDEIGQVNGMVAMVEDITERKQAEQELQAQRDFAMQVMNAMGQGLTVTDEERRFEFINPAYARMTGYLPEGLIGKTPYDVTLPEDHAILDQARVQRLEGGTSSYETRLKRSDGSTVPVLVTGAPRWREGKVAGAISVITDLTGRKQAEDALREHTAELQARNEELDAFAHTVAHDLKTPLSLVIGFAETLEDGCTAMSDEDMRRYLQAVARNGRKMENIIDELLLLAEVRRTEIEIAPLDMAGIVAEAQRRLAFLIEAYQAEVVLPAHWPIALGYGPWIEEVWVNYLSNALKYGGKPPRVELGALAQPDGMVRFWVCDNGPGTTPEDRTRLFVPFTQLAQVRATGHGLGLSIVRRIVEKLDGQVGVESESGAGSTFWFALPTLRRSRRIRTRTIWNH
jgi:PAS domain S-box-containing protein